MSAMTTATANQRITTACAAPMDLRRGVLVRRVFDIGLMATCPRAGKWNVAVLVRDALQVWPHFDVTCGHAHHGLPLNTDAEANAGRTVTPTSQRKEVAPRAVAVSAGSGGPQ